MIGRTLAHYHVTGALGAGGIGEVYRATDAKLGRDVAIKVLRAELAQDPDRLARFEREAKLLASLNHPNIAHVYGFESATLEDGASVHFLAMELVEGEDLAERLKRGAIPVEEALAIAKQIADALEEAHEKGIVHRDLKPANVKLTPDGKVKVLDFGLAKALAAEPLPSVSVDLSQSPTLAQTRTQAGVILGTAAYMSPEQARGKPVDKRADIWAFGVVLWEMLSGERLFEAESVPETLAAIFSRDLSLAELPASTPAAVKHLVGRCLERDPRRRLRDVGEARLVLDAPVDDSPEAEEPSGVVAATRPAAWLLAAVALASVLGTIGIEALLGRGRGAAPPSLARTAIRLPAPLWPALWDRPIALAPEGSRLAIAAFDPRQRRISLYLRALDDLRFQPLAGTEDASYPFWSPDGSAIGFFAGGKLKRIDLASRAVRTLCDAPLGRGAAWSPRGTIVFSPGAAGPLSQVSADGGAPTQLVELAHEGETQRNPHYLPDGRSVLFWALNRGAPGEQAIYAFDADRGETKKILDSPTEARYVAPGYLAYLADGNLMLQPFDAGRLELEGTPRAIASDVAYQLERWWISADLAPGGRLVYQETRHPAPAQLLWVDALGNETQAWSETLTNDLIGLRVSPEGRRAAAFLTDGNGVARNEVFDLEAGTRVRLGRIGERMFEPVWSPDGGRIAVELLHEGAWQLAWFPPRPDEVGQLLTSGRAMDERFPGSFTPDGRSVLFSQWAMIDKLGDLFLVDLEGGAQPRPFLTGPGQEFQPVLSPDGRFVAFLSDASDGTEIWVTDFPGASGRWQVSTGMLTLDDATAGRTWSESGWGWLSGDELWWSDEERHLVAAKIEKRGSGVEVVARRPLLGGRALTEDEAVLDYSFARQRFLLKRNVETATVPDLIFVSDWHQALAASAKP